MTTTATKQKTNVLVVLATGKMGSGVTDAFLASGEYNVFGTSRDANHAGLKAKGVTPVEFKFGDKQSALAALEKSAADVVFLNTDFALAAGEDGAAETAHGVAIVDACKERGVQHVVHCSVLAADTDARLDDFQSKLAVEKHLAASGLAYTVLRPGFFYENFHDAANENPLVKGALYSLVAPDAKMALVATRDVGNAAVKVLADRAAWAGKTVEAVAANLTLPEVAAALSEASGVACEYQVALPRDEVAKLSAHLARLCDFFDSSRYVGDAAAFRALVGPQVMGPKEYFAALGKWSDGEKFSA